MNFSEKSASFAKKILKHYPITQPTHQCSDHTHSHSHNHQQQTFQPFQHMHDHRKQRQIYEKPTQQKLQNMKYFKQMGNNCFKQKKYDEAAFFYNKTILYSDYTFPKQEEQIIQMQLLVQQANMNMAICLIKLDNWNKALINLRQAVKAWTGQKSQKYRKTVLNTRKKAYFWLTKYYIRQGNSKQANQQIQLLLQLDSQISTKQEAGELKIQLTQTIKKNEKKAQNISKKMFQHINLDV